MNTIRKKLHRLEENVISDVPNFGETLLLVSNDAERELHAKAVIILENRHQRLEAAIKDLESGLDINPNTLLNLNSDEQTIVFMSSSLMTQRIMHLFDMAVGSFIHLNDPSFKWIFYMRLNWFLKEMSEWLFLRWKEDQIISSAEFLSLCSGEQERRLKPVYNKWRNWLSPESWDKYFADHINFRSYDDLTSEEKAKLEQDAQIEEKEEAERSEQEKKLLNGKCSKCEIRCKWYYEQMKEKTNHENH